MLTGKEIDLLFRFCEDYGVEDYDVQVELVDHLAGAIERELTEHPEWSFQKALDKVFVSFGYTKFGPIIREKRKAAGRYCWKLFWVVFGEQFKGSWIPMAVLIWAYCYVWLFVVPRDILDIDATVAIVGCAITFIVLTNLGIRRMRRKSGKSFMLINMSAIGWLFPYPYMVVGFFGRHISIRWLEHTAPLSYMVFSFLCCFYIMMGIAFYRTFLRLRSKLEKDYPEVFFKSIKLL